MPNPVRQIIRRPAAAPTTGILGRAVDVSNLADDVIKMVVYGKNRVGKTTLACHFPKPLLLISFEPNRTGGAKSVSKMPGIKYLAITSCKEAVQLGLELKQDRTFKTVVLDSATSYQDLILREMLYGENSEQSIPEQLDWGYISVDQYRDRSSKTKEALRPWLNLDCHTVIIAKERNHVEDKNERNKIVRNRQESLRPEYYLASDLGAAAVEWLNDACDYICRMYLEEEVRKDTLWIPDKKAPGGRRAKVTETATGRHVHRLRTLFHTNCAAGFRSSDPTVVPEFIDGGPNDDPEYMVQEIFRVASGRRKEK